MLPLPALILLISIDFYFIRLAPYMKLKAIPSIHALTILASLCLVKLIFRNSHLTSLFCSIRSGPFPNGITTIPSESC